MESYRRPSSAINLSKHTRKRSYARAPMTQQLKVNWSKLKPATPVVGKQWKLTCDPSIWQERRRADIDHIQMSMNNGDGNLFGPKLLLFVSRAFVGWKWKRPRKANSQFLFACASQLNRFRKYEEFPKKNHSELSADSSSFRIQCGFWSNSDWIELLDWSGNLLKNVLRFDYVALATFFVRK